MRHAALFLPLLVVAACSTEPCGDDACQGSLAGEIADDSVLIGLDGMGEVLPDMLMVSAEANGDPVCSGAIGHWEVWRLDPNDFPVEFGVAPAGTREWVNEDVFPDGEATLFVGRRYVVSAVVRGFGGGGTAPVAWTSTFIGGDPESWQSFDVYCGS